VGENFLNIRPFSGLQATIAYRYLHSDRHYVGTEEQKERKEEGSQVINDLNTWDLALTYSVNPRLSFTLDVPWVDNNRSSAVRDNTAARNIVGRSHVQASGIGDVRLSVNWWLWDPVGHLGHSTPAESTGKGKAPVAANVPAGRRGNIRVSIGIDMPTGDEDARDKRSVYDPVTGDLVKDPNKVIVDQSIQPGDGGWGIPVDMYAYYNLHPRLTAYFQGSYLITPEEKNGVLTGRGNINDPTNNFESVMSIGDTWMARAGLDYDLLPQQGLRVSLGLRTEGQPVYDLIGGSKGFRRPGMNIAVEPAITWMKKGWSASLSVPITFYNERFQSVPDRQRTAATGIERHGDAAFADWYLMVSVGRQF
jgi:hypothetical protein